MTAAAGLLAYAGLLLAAAPRLARASWPDRAPRLAIAAWLALAYSAVASVALAGLAPLVLAQRLSGPLAWLLTDCGDTGGQLPAAAGGTLAAAVAARMAPTTTAATATSFPGRTLTPGSATCAAPSTAAGQRSQTTNHPDRNDRPVSARPARGLTCGSMSM